MGESMTAKVTSSPNVSVVPETRVLRRCLAVIGLIGIALIHLIDVPDKLEEVPYVGILFGALIVSSLMIAEMLIRADDARVWLAGGGLAGLTIVGYVISRTAGLPGDGGADLGNWTEPLGLVSLLVEAIVVQLTVMRLSRQSRS
jgi:hypothetical protein